jgi:hypothetical protein
VLATLEVLERETKLRPHAHRRRSADALVRCSEQLRLDARVLGMQAKRAC